MKGSFFELDEASCSIKPVQKPRPPIWIGANADPAIERAAEIGDCWYVNPHNRNDTLLRQLDVYKRALDKAGKPFPEEFPMRKEVFVAETREKALELAKPAISLKYQVYHSWGQDKVMPEGDNNLDLDWEELIDDRFVLGSPDEVTEQLLNLHKTLGVNHIIASPQGAGMPQGQVLDSLHMLGEIVLPNLKSA
jgi:alkanesulfonate monooxygenase SsuD/methylene tetrahydromethanopterin reductase-like flavin-dependent oxidoreductase (luciferase family)